MRVTIGGGPTAQEIQQEKSRLVELVEKNRDRLGLDDESLEEIKLNSTISRFETLLRHYDVFRRADLNQDELVKVATTFSEDAISMLATDLEVLAEQKAVIEENISDTILRHLSPNATVGRASATQAAEKEPGFGAGPSAG